jgi:Mg-chelatase subunit ChlD
LIIAALIGIAGVGGLLYQMNNKKQRGELLKEKATKPPKKEEELEAETLGENPEVQQKVEKLIQEAAKNKGAPTTKSVFGAVMEKVFMDSIKKVIKSNQTENVKEYMTIKADGKTSWSNTHFIFSLDCSGSMKGSRWDAVTIGYDSFMKNVKNMPEIYISAFTFDTKVNPFCKERTVDEAIECSSQIPFTGKGTNYKRALEYAINLIEKSTHPDHLVCIMFLSDGLSTYPAESVKRLMEMREQGKKIIFYTIACETDEDEDMIKMATQLEGEHYKVTAAEASRLVFSAILKV